MMGSTDSPPNLGATQTHLCLYIAGESPRSRAALHNARKICEAHEDWTLEVIDLTRRPELAKADEIVAVPTLLRKRPEPIKRIIGTLSDLPKAAAVLEVEW